MACERGGSWRYRHAAGGWLVEQLRGIGAQTARQIADLLPRRPAVTQQQIDLRQSVAHEATELLAILGDEGVDTAGAALEFLAARALFLHGGDEAPARRAGRDMNLADHL